MFFLIPVFHWLVAQGLYKDLIAATVAFLVGHFLAWRPAKKIVKANAKQQERIADLLDTETPGGMHDVVEHLKKLPPRR